MGSYDSEGSSFYVDDSDADSSNIKAMMDHYYTSAYPMNASFWQQGSIDKRFKAGDQSLWSMIYGDNQYYQARRFFFNLIRRQTNMMEGYQRRNRKSTVTVPIHQDDALSDDYNEVLKFCEGRDGFQEYFSQSFAGGIDTGLSLLHMYPDYTLDPISGDLFTDQVSYNNVLIDPYFRKMDLTDCAFIWRRRWVNKTQAKALLPDKAKEIDKLRPSGAKDGRFPLQAELINLDTNRLFAYDEFHYRSTRKAKIIIDPKTDDATEWEDDDEMLDQVMRMQPWLVQKEIEVPTVKLAISLGGKVQYHGKNQLNIDLYPFAPMLCYHEPDIQSYAWRIQGVVRGLRDCQYLYNMRKVIEMDILQSQINSGWIYPVDVVVDPKAFRQTGQGFLVPLKAGRQPTEIQRITPPDIPMSMLELSRILAEDIQKISGINEELLGSATDDKAGILSMLRQGAGLTTLQTIYDKADYTQRLYGRIRLEAIRKNFSEHKVERILGRKPQPNFFTSNALKYSIQVEEGNYSATQRQTELQQLLHFREIGIPVANKTILNAAIITNKAQVIADMEEEQQQQAQQAQAQAQAESQKNQSDVMSKYAKSRVDLAREQEILAKITTDKADAIYKQSETELNLVKEMIALEDMDYAQMRNAFELAQMIKQANQPAATPQLQAQGAAS